ncbi:MAG TPA: ankyrin repeat domain-containing protein [Vicinamibacterales bacterium]|nr:ankyrin repeat domain-containing protein [Vicinamibacterales bacterium]
MQRQLFGAFLVLLSVTVAVRAAGSDVADAVMRGDLAAARALIQKGSDVNAPQGDKATALHWAVYRDSVEAVDMLVRAGAKSSPNREGMTPLAMAALFGNPQIVDRLIKAGADAKALGPNGESMVMFAARNGNPDVIKVLVEAGANVNAREPVRGTTALMWAVEQRHPEAVAALLKAGADPAARSAGAGLPRNYIAPRVNTRAVEEAQKRRERAKAAGRTYEEQLEFEFQNGQDLGGPRNAFTGNRAGGAGQAGGQAGAAPQPETTAPQPGNAAQPAGNPANTPTQQPAGAVQPPATSDQAPAVANTAGGGAAAGGRAARGRNGGGGGRGRGAGGRAGGAVAQTAASDAGAPEPVEDDSEVVVAGLVGGGGGGLTPLVFAAREGDIESTRLLLAAKADVNQTTEYGWTPLLTAVNNRNYQLAKLLLDNGANPNLANKGGWTPLYLATDNRNIEGGDYPVPKPDMDHFELIKVLLEKGADPNARVKDNTLTRTIFTMQWFYENGATAFIRAAQSSDTALMKLLLDYKADPKAMTAQGDNALTASAGIGWVDGVTYERSPKENLEAVRMLLDLGLDPNSANQEGRTPLMGAALKGRPDVIQLLVDRGARLDTRDRGSRDTHIPGATIAGLTWEALDYAEGLVRVGVQSAVERPEAVALIRKLMTERGMKVPPANRTINSICVVALCDGQ